MRLYDHFLAEPNGYRDRFMLGAYTRFAADLKQAQCFELTRDVMLACGQVLSARPSTIIGAYNKIRPPYQLTWIEFRAADRLGAEHLKMNDKPLPDRMGCLIKSSDYRTGSATFGWSHPTGDLMLCPVGCIFDWSLGEEKPVGDRLITVADLRDDHPVFDSEFVKRALSQRKTLRTFTPQSIREGMSQSTRAKYGNDPAEVEAFQQLEMRALCFPNEYCFDWVTANKHGPKSLANFIDDITGELPFIEAFLLMLNSRNAIETTHDDFAKLNNARRKNRKPPLKEFTTTHLRITKVGRNRSVARFGEDRAAARLHTVRGHFKVRKSGVYWWSEFERGSGEPIGRAAYKAD